MKTITRTIWILSLVSLFTDAATEMLYPVMPAYLREIGFSVLLIGLLEGLAEAITGISKAYFGKWSDLSHRRLPFIQWGYFLSTISKPLMVVFNYTGWIFMLRTTDRLGKGIRTAARDALLSDEATESNKGTVFGFHRMMDTFGAVIGPLVALIFLHYNPGEYKTLFIVSIVPGMLAVLSSLLLKEKSSTTIVSKDRPGILTFLKYLKQSEPAFRKLMLGLILFTLVNSTDVFLLLRIKEEGGSDTDVIQLYMLFNLVYALASLPLGKLADRVGIKTIFIFGLIIYSIVYLGMGLTNSLEIMTILIVLYGLFSAATEGISKAWISLTVKKTETATAIGTYASLQSLGTLIASSTAGLLWNIWGSSMPFLFTGTCAIGIILLFIIYVPFKPESVE